MDVLDTILKWVVAPLAGFLGLVYKTQQQHATEIAVLKAEASAARAAHMQEVRSLQTNMSNIMNKLDSIETALRK
ncbi:MAG: hypothetical protein E6Q97_09600 [Desulfurellales bacterium]|nr:MAG: hypothetical protein E6Q97_09600 [Desulfurellales bacterium]